jgi:hypothetical protein
MKYLALAFILLSEAGFAQQHCETLFAASEQVVQELAKLYVEKENLSPMMVKILEREYKKKYRLAQKSGVDLSNLNEKIQTVREQQGLIDQEEQKRIEEIKKNENERLRSRMHLPPFLKPI